jgi:hypothetical protein
MRTWVFVGWSAIHAMAFANGPQLYANANRTELEAARRAQTEVFEERDRRCYATFAVTQCLNRVQSERLAAQAELNRRERHLNDVQRAQQAQEQRERTEKKLAERNAKFSELASRNADPGVPRLMKKSNEPVAAPRPTREVRSTNLSAEARATNRKEYEQRQLQAQEKRQMVNERIKAATKPAKALPLPP